ncbi:CLC_0170 family protein [Neobacillus sp. NPDC093182]|uniref:CLC_0170 family protein n=1 Tax=Neobacillus sp. NPDC093182 TaxID=3364297 RepID=UPI003810CD92
MYIGYFHYVIVLCWVTGGLILFTDVKAYKNASLKKEHKVSKYLGWVNILIGFGIITADFIYSHFMW